IFGATPAREITDEQWRTYFEVNCLRQRGLSVCICQGWLNVVGAERFR
ncbi:MAG: hypothetical protein JWQ31_3233, partial [Mycobacterium sp.]|nr:hypothetical protein [Mycobacterium sp.]